MEPEHRHYKSEIFVICLHSFTAHLCFQLLSPQNSSTLTARGATAARVPVQWYEHDTATMATHTLANEEGGPVHCLRQCGWVVFVPARNQQGQASGTWGGGTSLKS